MSFFEVTLRLLQGFQNTLFIFFITLLCAIPLGLVVNFGSMSKFKPLKAVTRGFIWVIRGTPLMLQIIIVFYGPGLWFDYPMRSRELAVALAFIINYACYFSEIYRGGIESIPKGQKEAAFALGLTKKETFFKIILPQVFKRITPPLSNEVITLVKDTSLAQIISVGEVLFAANEIRNQYAMLYPLFYCGAFYLLFSGILTIIFSKIEKKLDYYKV